MINKISPSMMCCDFFNLEKHVKTFEEKNIELLHIDIMDGNFVPNFALGTDFVKQLKKVTNIPLDIHFMTEFPERHIASFPMGEGDYVSIHYETTKHLQRVLQAVKNTGANVLVAINPSTPVEALVDILDDIDGILIMTVNPGFAGQKMVPHSIDKIARARKFLNDNGKEHLEIEVDGNVSIENAIKMKNAGANIFAVGTASLFGGGDIAINIDKFRNEVFN